jgi:hypothetical protein
MCSLIFKLQHFKKKSVEQIKLTMTFCRYRRFFYWILDLFQNCSFCVKGCSIVLHRMIRFHLEALHISISDVMVRVIASSAVDRGFESRSGQIKDYEIDICCFYAKHEILRRKSKDWLAGNQNNVSKWSNMFILGLLFQCASSIKIKLSLSV